MLAQPLLLILAIRIFLILPLWALYLDKELNMSSNADILTTLYVVWIAASMAVLVWAYRHIVKDKLLSGLKRSS